MRTADCGWCAWLTAVGLPSVWSQLTSSHTHSVREAEYVRLSSEWTRLVRRELSIWAAFHRHWLAAPAPLLAVRYEDLLDGGRRQETLQLIAAFLCKHAQAADAASPAAADAALRGMIDRVGQAAAATEARGGTRRAGVYAPRRGKAGAALVHYSQQLREEVVAAAGGEMCLFKYETDLLSDTLGKPLPGPPHAVYLDPAGAQPDAPRAGSRAKGAQRQEAARGEPRAEPRPLRPRASLVLNQGVALRPAEDARGWKWKEQLELKRDASLLHAPGAVARIDYQTDGWCKMKDEVS